MTLRDLLNRALWRDGDMHALEIRVAHRGAPAGVRRVAGSCVLEVNASGILLAPDMDGGEGIFLPYHRFLGIARDGEVLWGPDVGFLDRQHAVVAQHTKARGAARSQKRPPSRKPSEPAIRSAAFSSVNP